MTEEISEEQYEPVAPPAEPEPPRRYAIKHHIERQALEQADFDLVAPSWKQMHEKLLAKVAEDGRPAPSTAHVEVAHLFYQEPYTDEDGVEHPGEWVRVSAEDERWTLMELRLEALS